MHGVPLAHPPGVIFLYPLPSPTPYNWPTCICMETHTHTPAGGKLIHSSASNISSSEKYSLCFWVRFCHLDSSSQSILHFSFLLNITIAIFAHYKMCLFPLRYKPDKGSPFLLCSSVSHQRKDSEHGKYLLNEGIAKLILLFIPLFFLSLYWAFLVLNHHSTFVEQV